MASSTIVFFIALSILSATVALAQNDNTEVKKRQNLVSSVQLETFVKIGDASLDSGTDAYTRACMKTCVGGGCRDFEVATKSIEFHDVCQKTCDLACTITKHFPDEDLCTTVCRPGCEIMKLLGGSAGGGDDVCQDFCDEGCENFPKPVKE